MMGKPVVKGTRITVELILEELATGESIEQILDQHPGAGICLLEFVLTSLRPLP